MRLSYHDIHFMLFQTSTLTLMVMASSTITNPITTPSTFQPHRKKGKIIVIMGATGTGNSCLSIDLGTGYFPSEINNSDKMQVYKSLVLTTNKIYLHERQNIIHHLLGEFDWQDGELTPFEFCHLAHLTVLDINSCKITPFIAGGSNSFSYALLVKEEHKRYPAQNSVSAAQQILLPSVDNQSILLAMGTSIAPASYYCSIASGSPFCEFKAYTAHSLMVMDLNGGFINNYFKSPTAGFYSKGELVFFQKIKWVKCSKGGRAQNIAPGRIRRLQRRRNKKDKDDEDDGEDNRRPSDSDFLSLILLTVLILMLFLMVLSLIFWLMS